MNENDIKFIDKWQAKRKRGGGFFLVFNISIRSIIAFILFILFIYIAYGKNYTLSEQFLSKIWVSFIMIILIVSSSTVVEWKKNEHKYNLLLISIFKKL